ncbi:MAG: tetratricopeptide repeat protein [Anaerolineales bacterium]|nr:tetratricopeptide repeat protein [Anaerolineales bacterium]
MSGEPKQTDSQWSSGSSFGQQDVHVGGDVVGRDKISASGGQFIASDRIVHQIQSTSLTALHQLPAPLPDFVNRERDLAGLLESVDKGANLLSLHGMGGVGKTALALVLARRLALRYPDAQLFLDLRGSSPDPVLPAEAMLQVIRAYHPVTILPEKESELGALYRSLLNGQRTLLLFDDAANAEQVKPLIPPTHCLLIITSRRKFSLPGLRPTSLELLSAEDARELLLRIAPDIGPRAGAITKLAGYLPLALRLVGNVLAERPDLTPEDLEHQLRDASRRLQLTGVETSMGVSYGTLDADLQWQWRILSVFPGSFDLAAAAAVWEAELEPARESLSALIRYSLLDFEPDQERYRIPTLVRDYALARLAPGERDEAALRHARHFLRVLRDVDAQELGLVDRLRQLDSDWNNIRAGQAWAAANQQDNDLAARLCTDYPLGSEPILTIRLAPREMVRWLEEAITSARRLNDRAAEGQHLSALGRTHADLGNTRRAVELYEAAQLIARELRARPAESNLLGRLGNAYAESGDSRRAIGLYKEALAIASEIGDRRNESSLLGGLGNAYADLGEIRRAIEVYEQAIAVAREFGDLQAESAHLGNLGQAYASLGEIRRAVEIYERALNTAREIRDRRSESNFLGRLGVAAAETGDARRAIAFYEQALAIAREVGDRLSEGAHLGNLGLAYSALGETGRAIELYEQRLAIARDVGDRRGEGNALGNIGNAYMAQAERQPALKYYQEARVIAREIGDRLGEATASGGLGDAYLGLGDVDAAINQYERQLAMVRELGHRPQENIALRALGKAYAAQGDAQRAVGFFRQALAIVRELGDLRSEGDVLWELSEAERERGDHLEAARSAAQALIIYNRIQLPNQIDQAKIAVLAYLEHEQSEVRQVALAAVAERAADNDQVRIAIQLRLDDSDEHVRQLAVETLAGLAPDDAGVRQALLARLNDSSPVVQQAVIQALSGLMASDPEVRAALFPRLSRPSYERPSLDLIAREFFAAAGIEVRPLTNPLEFVCHPTADFWRPMIVAPVYTSCLLGHPLNRNNVMAVYEAARAISAAPKLIFVVIDQTPDEGGLIEIGALRAAEGVQVIPVDDAVIQQGRELQKEQEKLREHLQRFIGRRNHYDVRNPVVDRLNFFGREPRANELAEVLEQGRPLGLFGLRKMGKSSFMRHLRDRATFPVAYVDLQAGEELTALYNRILGSWQRSLRVRLPQFNWTPPVIVAEASSSFVTAVHDLIARLEVLGHTSRLGLFIDEIEVMVPRPSAGTGSLSLEELNRYLSFARALRGLVQETDRLSLLVVGVDPQFNRVSRWHGQQNPFYQFFREEYLGPLSRDECVQMVRNIGRQMDLDYTDEAASFVAEVSGGHPFLARQLCSSAIEALGTSGVSRIELSHLVQAAERFIRQPGTADLLNENGLWGEVTDPALWPMLQVIENRAILTGLSRSDGQPEAVLVAGGSDRTAREKSVFELEHRTVLGRLEQMLMIRFDLFKQWIERYQVRME